MKIHDPRIKKDVSQELVGKMVALKPPASSITGKIIKQNFDCLTVLWDDGEMTCLHQSTVLISR